jgi:hypothetical protein
MDVVCVDPLIVFIVVALPFDEVLKSSAEVARVEDLLDFILFYFTIDHYRRWGRGLPSPWEGIFGGWGELDHWEHRV